MLFQIFALVILLAFYGCYLGKMIVQRKKGIHTDQIGKGKVGEEKAIEITMKIATYLVLAAEVLSILLGITHYPLPLRIAGLFISFAGTVIFIISVLTMQDSWRAGVSKADQTELVTNGIYQISRNPAFLGFDLVYIGMVMTFFHWGLFLLSVWAMVMFHLQIVKVEEPFLFAAFGNAYLQYRKNVNRYIGRRQ